MRLSRTRPRTTQTTAGITTLHGVTMQRRTSVWRKTRMKNARSISAVVLSDFVPPSWVLQRETALTACMRRECSVCKQKNLGRT